MIAQMRKSLIVLCLGLMGCQAAGPAFTDEDAAEIRSVIDSYVSSTLAGDWGAWGATLDANIIFFPPNEGPVVGHDAVMTWVEAFPPITAFTYQIQDVRGEGDVGVAHGTYALSATLEDGSPMIDDGSWVNVFARQPDGSWLYLRNIWNSNLPLPEPDPAV